MAKIFWVVHKFAEAAMDRGSSKETHSRIQIVSALPAKIQTWQLEGKHMGGQSHKIGLQNLIATMVFEFFLYWILLQVQVLTGHIHLRPEKAEQL